MQKLLHILVLILVSASAFSQSQAKSYDYYEKLYDHFSKNDPRALPIISQSIKAAEVRQDFRHLSYVYEDAVYFSQDKSLKLHYANRGINSALRTGDQDLLAKAYLGKGIVYYSNFRDYKSALDQYVKADTALRESSDGYLKNKVRYHIGIVKNYLGYYNEAKGHFQEALNYFKGEFEKKNLHPNVRHNMAKGTLNSLYQLSLTLRNLEEYAEARVLINEGLVLLNSLEQFSEERGKFHMSRGIDLFYSKDYKASVSFLSDALLILKHEQDFTAIAMSHFYLGRARLKSGDKVLAKNHFLVVDSLFSTHGFLTPELHANYQFLIQNINSSINPKEELYYTKQLLKADSVIHKHSAYMSNVVLRTFKPEVESKWRFNDLLKSINLWTLGIASLILVSAIVSLLFVGPRKKRRCGRKLKLLRLRLLRKARRATQSTPSSSRVLNPYTEEQIEAVVKKLTQFEKTQGFLESGLKLESLAKELGHPPRLVSYVINRIKQESFTTYINRLRVEYTAMLLVENSKYRKYSVMGLSKLCGMSSRQNFSKLFHDIIGMPPIIFIQLLNDENKRRTSI